MQISPGAPAPANPLLGFLPVLVTFLIGLATLIIQWLKEFSRDAKRLRRWEEARHAVEYWEAHVGLLNKVLATDDKRLGIQKEIAYNASMRVSSWVTSDLRPPIAVTALPKASSVGRQILLLLPTSRHKDWRFFLVTRFAFWVIGVSSLVIAIYLFRMNIGEPQFLADSPRIFNLSNVQFDSIRVMILALMTYLYRQLSYREWARVVRRHRARLMKRFAEYNTVKEGHP